MGRDFPVDIVETFGRQRRARRGEESHRAQIVSFSGLDAEFLRRAQEPGRNAKERCTLALGEVEERGAVAIHGEAVIEQDRRAARERRGEPVPHHPSGRGRIEHAIAGANVAMQLMLLHMLHKRAAGAMNDAFRRARRAGGEHHIERVVEWQEREAQWSAVMLGERLAPALRLREACSSGGTS